MPTDLRWSQAVSHKTAGGARTTAIITRGIYVTVKPTLPYSQLRPSCDSDRDI